MVEKTEKTRHNNNNLLCHRFCCDDDIIDYIVTKYNIGDYNERVLYQRTRWHRT